MEIVILCALGVGGATLFGSVLGFIFKGITHRFSDIVLAFGAGVMLSASVFGLIMPSLEYGGNLGFLTTIIGIFCGAVSIDLLDKIIPHLQKFPDAMSDRAQGCKDDSDVRQAERLKRVMLFVIAIGMHNLPEGIAAGVAAGSGNTDGAVLTAVGIALQNIPEGMVIIGPMLSAGISSGKTCFYALLTGATEVLGTFIGYYAVGALDWLLPFALAFAGGTMLYIISDEIIPDTHSDGAENGATYALLAGFSLMLAVSVLI